MSALSCASLRAQGKVSSLPCPLGRACPDHRGKLGLYDKEPASSGSSETGDSLKKDFGKDPWHLAPWDAFLCIVKVLAFGAAKYEPRGWEQGMQWSRVYAALQRHLFAWWSRGGVDPDTGYSHLWHSGCCVCFLIAYELRGKGEDDRPNDAHPRAAVEADAPKPLPRFVAPMPLVVGKHYRILSLGVDGAPQHAVGDILLCAAEGEYLHNGINYYDRKGIKCYFAKKTKEGGTWIHEVEQID